MTNSPTPPASRDQNRFASMYLFSGQHRIRHELHRPALELPRLTPTPTLTARQAAVELLTNASCGD